MAVSACSVPGCEALARAKGLCEAHYRRHRVGAPLVPIRRRAHRPSWEAFKAAASAYGRASSATELATAERTLALKARAWVFEEGA